MIKPMLASSISLEEVLFPCYAQLKLDGIRCLMIKGIAYSRTGKLIPNKNIQELALELKEYELDGELIVNQGRTTEDFLNAQSIVCSIDKDISSITYVVYDIPNKDKTLEEFIQLKLNNCRCSKLLSVRVNSYEELIEYYSKVIDQNFEGIIVRYMGGVSRTYKHGRSTKKEGLLLKIKPIQDNEAIIVGFEEYYKNIVESELDELGYKRKDHKKENLKGMNILGSFLVEAEGKQFSIGSGLTLEQREIYWNNKEELIGKYITYNYVGITKYGIPRFPTFKYLRTPL
jgi:DNA ligase-1